LTEGPRHPSSEVMDTVNEVPVTGDIPTLSMMWALEDSDQMPLSGDILDAPELEPTFSPNIHFDPADALALKQPSRRRRLARLRHEKAIRMARQWEQPYDASLQKDRHARMKLRNEDSRHRTKKHADCTSEVTENKLEPTKPLLIASATTCLPVHIKHGEATNVRLPANTDASAPPQPLHNMSRLVLAGAASLGLRRIPGRSTSESPAHQCMHPTSTGLKGEALAHERVTISMLQQRFKETNKVPHAPSKPALDSTRKRPQIRGAAVHMTCAD